MKPPKEGFKSFIGRRLDDIRPRSYAAIGLDFIVLSFAA